MNKPLLLAIDQGTTSSRAIVFNAAGDIVAIAQKELTQHFPRSGWVEQNAMHIWNDTLAVCREVVAEAGASNIVSIGIANQRETTIIWDRATGAPIHGAIVWQDRRTADRCRELVAAVHEDMVRARTGLLIDPYFSGTKIAWILDHVDGARGRAEAGELAFGTVDSWLLWNLTEGRVHATDATNAARTMLYDSQRQAWDDDLLAMLNIPKAILPDVRDNVAEFGHTTLLGPSLPIGGMAGDQHAAVIGQACFEPGMVKSTYGTGCFALMNIGRAFRESCNRLLTTPAYRIGGEVTFAIEGSIFISGAAVQWLRDGLHLFDQAAASEALAMSVPDSNGVYFVPAFTGLGAPYWNPEARGMICGLTRDTNAAHLARAALEAQAYQTLGLMEAMKADSGFAPDIIRADGGLAANRFVCQFLADMLDLRVDIPKVRETTAWGAACLAGLSCGVFADLDAIAHRWTKGAGFVPDMESDRRQRLHAGWRKAVDAVRGLTETC